MLVDVSGAAILRSEQALGRRQAFPGAYLVGKAAQTIIATSESYEYPLGPGVTNTKIDRRSRDLVPARVSATQLGDGKAALEMLQQVGLL